MANWIDLSVLAVLGLFGLRGFFRGLFREVLSLAGLVTGFIVASRYNEAAAAWGAQFWQLSPFIFKAIAFVALFFMVYFCFSLAGWLLHRSEKLLFLKTINRLGGVAVGVGKGTALVGLLALFLTSASWLPDATRQSLEGAVLVAPLSQWAESLWRLSKNRLLATPAKAGGAL